ncbi:MAG: M28 family peptidase [Planctomycetota bacterium]
MSETGRKSRFAIKIISRGAAVRLAVAAVFFAIFCSWAYFAMIRMPGKSYVSPLPRLTGDELSLRDRLADDIEKLAGQIGERNVWRYNNLTAAADFIEKSLAEAGYEVHRQNYQAEGKSCSNIEVELTGAEQPEQIVVIGAHYDSVYSSPGANDNGSGVAAILALARSFAAKKTARTLRFVLFANEEPPFYHTGRMGSMVYAKRCKSNNEAVTAMLALETIGYYTEKRKSQKYPFPFNLVYPSTGNFIGFVSNLSSLKLLHTAIGSFRKGCKFPSEGGAIPEIIPGINWSDHWSFWQQGYPAIMVTDTALFRYPYYHSPEDTPEKIDYDCLARVVFGLEGVIAEIAGVREN